MLKHILVVEDDEVVNQLVSTILIKKNYKVTRAYSGTEALLQMKIETFDLAVLDLMLPGVSGEELIEKFQSKNIPVLVLSAKASIESKISVLDLGADDYMTKPFDGFEVAARVNAILRRHHKELDLCKVTYKALSMDEVSREIQVCGQLLSLTKNEFELLSVLIKSPKKVFSRENLYNEVWPDGNYIEDNTINVHISNIRKKIKKLSDEDYIKTVWGIGFKLSD